MNLFTFSLRKIGDFFAVFMKFWRNWQPRARKLLKSSDNKKTHDAARHGFFIIELATKYHYLYLRHNIIRLFEKSPYLSTDQVIHIWNF